MDPNDPLPLIFTARNPALVLDQYGSIITYSFRGAIGDMNFRSIQEDAPWCWNIYLHRNPIKITFVDLIFQHHGSHLGVPTYEFVGKIGKIMK